MPEVPTAVTDVTGQAGLQEDLEGGNREEGHFSSAFSK